MSLKIGICKFNNSYCSGCNRKHIKKGEQVVYQVGEHGNWSSAQCANYEDVPDDEFDEERRSISKPEWQTIKV